MAQSLTILWAAPIPNPTCNYIVAYRAKSAASYTFVNTSGSTSGINSLVVPTILPACYEGFVQSNCCGDNLSDVSTSKWGVNAWQPFYVNAWVVGTQIMASIYTLYPNPYPLFVNFTYHKTNTSGTTSSSFSGQLPANNTYYSAVAEVGIPAGTTISSVLTPSWASVFDNGGNLQQKDTVNTPQYFGFYNTSGCTSGTTSGCTPPVWNGSPITLPSFTLDGFNVTNIDTMGNPIGGNLLVSWIQAGTFGGGAGIYHTITFQIFDLTGTILQGLVTVPYGVPGLNNATIPILSTLGTIDIYKEYMMKTLWADTSVSGTALFFLPTF